jgi:hypothetical protein
MHSRPLRNGDVILSRSGKPIIDPRMRQTSTGSTQVSSAADALGTKPGDARQPTLDVRSAATRGRWW